MDEVVQAPRHGYDGEAGDADAGGRGGDAAACGAGLGGEADRARARLQPRTRFGAICARAAGRRIEAPQRPGTLDGREDWLAERFRRHRGNADVVRQELEREHGIRCQPAHGGAGGCAHLRRELRGRGAGTVRFETPPGRAAADRLRRDLDGDRRRAWCRVHLFVATLGYSRRALRRRCSGTSGRAAWFDGLEGGVPPLRRRAARGAARQRQGAGRCITMRQTREVTLQRALPRLLPLLGLPAAGLRAVSGAHQGQGRARRRLRQAQRDRRARPSPRWAALEAHLAWWMREIADRRVHGTTGEAADRALRARRGGGAAAARRSAAVPAGARAARGGFRRTAASSSTPTATACRGG